MSDSFADLWSSSAPLPPKPKPQTLSSANSSSSNRTTNSTPNQPYRASSKPDVFALLAGSGSGSSSPYGNQQQQRYGSPNTIGSNPSSRPISALGGQRSNSTTPSLPLAPSRSTSKSGSGDAFGDLFSSSKGDNGSGQAHAGMTLAARLAMEAQQRSQAQVPGSKLQSQPQRSNGGGDAWAGLDTLAGGFGVLGGGNGSASASQAPKKPVKVDDTDDWGLGDFGASSSKPQRSQPQPKPQPQTQQKKTLWDLDDFATPNAAAASSSSSSVRTPPQAQSISRSGSSASQRPRIPEHIDSPDDDFDFGNREDEPTPRRAVAKSGLLDLDDDDFGASQTSRTQRAGLLGSDDEGDDWGSIRDERRGTSGGFQEEEEDVLGMLSKPVEVVRASSRPTKPTTQTSTSSSTNGRQTTTRTASPPPHILGQIVEMGFSIPQAKQALARTANGQDVQAALEMLLGGGSGANTPASIPIERARDSEQPPPLPSRPRVAPKGQKERERERQERMRREREDDGPVVTDVQEQADKLLSQASEIGLSVLSKATAFWKEGKQKVVQAYEERAASAGAGSSGPRTDGRPKWMQEDAPGFKDDDDADRAPPQRHRPPPPQEQRPQPPTRTRDEESIDLFSSPPAPSNGQRQPQSMSISRQSSASFSAPVTRQRRPPTPPPTKNRNLPSASPSSLSTALKHKTAGTEQFKLGQYGTATESYTLAINALPAGHLLLLPLYTNRSLARIRTGEYKGAAEDAGLALIIVLGSGPESGGGGLDSFDPTATSAGTDVNAASWNPSLEAPHLLAAAQQRMNNGGWQHAQGVGVDLHDGYVKALRRRAEASEGRERWNEALKDWEVLTAGGWIQDAIKKDAARGAARCRKMVDGETTAVGTSVPTTAPKPRPKPAAKPKPVSVPTAPSAALKSLQATTAQAEADDTLKHQLKDSVDARLAAWRTGKETNIRALLASLDLVLWEELLRGVKVGGLHELVTPAQVKKGYVKSIARVHPDKLNAQNSTVEQRMLANGVFGTLNEAWIAFQSGK